MHVKGAECKHRFLVYVGDLPDFLYSAGTFPPIDIESRTPRLRIQTTGGRTSQEYIYIEREKASKILHKSRKLHTSPSFLGTFPSSSGRCGTANLYVDSNTAAAAYADYMSNYHNVVANKC